MPGSAIIVGIIPCYDCRVVNDDKPRTITSDGEINLGTDNNSNVLTSNAAIQYFTPLSQPLPSSGSLYFVHGKIVIIESDMNVGSEHKNEEYDFFIEADMVSVVCDHLFKYIMNVYRCADYLIICPIHHLRHLSFSLVL